MKVYKTRKDEIKELDKLFSEYLRKKISCCERCGGATSRKLQVHHFIRRRNYSVRYDDENCVVLCGGCHMYFHSHPIEEIEWTQNRLGDRYDLLRARSIQTRTIDRELIKLDLRERLKEYE